MGTVFFLFAGVLFCIGYLIAPPRLDQNAREVTKRVGIIGLLILIIVLAVPEMSFSFHERGTLEVAITIIGILALLLGVPARILVEKNRREARLLYSRRSQPTEQ